MCHLLDVIVLDGAAMTQFTTTVKLNVERFSNTEWLGIRNMHSSAFVVVRQPAGGIGGHSRDCWTVQPGRYTVDRPRQVTFTRVLACPGMSRPDPQL